jgi:phage/conjugal plasmid C-4 type zinc finger TraR family protein
MGDWLDRVQALELRHREQAIAAVRARTQPATASRSHCLDCEGEIPSKRQAFGGVTRCMPCQITFEKNT